MLPATGPVDAAVLMSQALFERAQVVVLADAEQQGAAAQLSTKLGAPLLLVPAPEPSPAASVIPASATVIEEITRLDPDIVIVAGPHATALAEQADRDTVELDPKNPLGTDDLPRTEPSALDGDLTVLTTSPSVAAAQATAQAVGAAQLTVPSGDPRAAEAMKVLQSTEGSILGVGQQFVDSQTLARRMEVVRTGVELPGGGQVLFPGRMMVALYGHPGAPVLGVLGEKDLDATIARAKEHASWYEEGSPVPVVPTLEIIATIASAKAGADGDYSSEYPASQYQPYVDAAAKQGVYVVLDLQPGRDRLLHQAKQYELLLSQPHVGLAIDPEWKLHGNETPLRQIGHIDAEEINEVTDWLADLSRSNKLPQKLVVLHQFRLSMLADRQDIDTSHDELSVLIHADGQGTQGMKQATWAALRQDRPANVTWGWKNFYDEDSPTLTPQATLQIQPRPDLVSYQ